MKRVRIIWNFISSIRYDDCYNWDRKNKWNSCMQEMQMHLSVTLYIYFLSSLLLGYVPRFLQIRICVLFLTMCIFVSRLIPKIVMFSYIVTSLCCEWIPCFCGGGLAFLEGILELLFVESRRRLSMLHHCPSVGTTNSM